MTWRPTGVGFDTLPLGGLREALVANRSIVLARVADAVFAVDAFCPHAGGILAEGTLEGHRLACPIHEASFDVRDGRVLADPYAIEPPQGTVEGLGYYPTRVVAGMVEVDLG